MSVEGGAGAGADPSLAGATVATTGFAWKHHPDQVNLGCGFDKRDGFLNVDFGDWHHPDLVADIRELGMLPDGRYRTILAYDCLEHLPRHDTHRALSEWFRICAPGGVIKLRVPNVVVLGEWLRNSDDVSRHEEVLHLMYGTQAYTGDYHLTSFTDVTLMHALGAAGFTDIRFENRDHWMFDVEARRPLPGEARSRLVGRSWDGGWHSLEQSATETWRWSSGEGRLLLYNTTTEALPVAVRMKLHTGSPTPVRVQAGGSLRAVVTSATAPVEVVLPWELAPGPNRVDITSDGPPIESAADPRRLVFRVIDFEVIEGDAADGMAMSGAVSDSGGDPGAPPASWPRLLGLLRRNG